MTDISVIILVGQEKLHMRRCLKRLAPLEPRDVFVITSQPNDGTEAFAREMGAKVIFHDWPGTQAAQFDWSLDNLPIDGEWVLRLDADEYLTEELIAEIKAKLPRLPDDVDGVVLKRRHMWRGKWVKRGMYPTRILRLFRTGRGKSDGKMMDEHIVVQGRVVEFENDFVDHSLISLEEWEAKHRGYARREAESFLSDEKSTGAKAKLKWVYYHFLPSCLRPWIYYIKRAFVSGAYFECGLQK